MSMATSPQLIEAMMSLRDVQCMYVCMYIEEEKQKRFVLFTGQKTKSSQGRDWMPQSWCITKVPNRT